MSALLTICKWCVQVILLLFRSLICVCEDELSIWFNDIDKNDWGTNINEKIHK